MKLRFDMAAKVTGKMLKESVVANNHRYKAEPLFSKTGTGSLSTASTAERAIEDELSLAITRKLMPKPRSSGKRRGRKS